MYVADMNYRGNWCTKDEHPYFLERLEGWMTEKKQEALDKLFVNHGKIHPALAKSLAYAAIENESYAVSFAESVKWTSDNMYALLGWSERCEDSMLESLGD